MLFSKSFRKLSLSKKTGSPKFRRPTWTQNSNRSDSDEIEQLCYLQGNTFQSQFFKVNNPESLFKIYSDLPNRLSQLTRVEKASLWQKCQCSRRNQQYNRSAFDLPFDFNRVKLQLSNDYINASYITMDSTDRRYIVAQTPICNPQDCRQGPVHPKVDTIGMFWYMVLQHRASVVINLMRTPINPNRRREGFPDNVGDCVTARVQLPSARFVQIVVVTQTKDICADWEYRKLSIQCQDQTLELAHFCVKQFTKTRLLQQPESFVRFLVSFTEVFESGSHLKPNQHLIVVHCRGSDLCGLFIVADLCLLRIRRRRSLQIDLDIIDLVHRLCEQRCGLVSAAGQVKLLFDLVNWSAKVLAEYNFRLNRHINI